ncbi:cell division checkpoint GTPase YihA [Candidatus Ruthia magnifica str. Cm (Calyptogena magnifica)]|uniref:Probable GTP-binding protein EngB n=1 Tax=Ruthia magnifica subsp. Calyptogena magnifica TaxID=413404 RepID=ENGB_RUTMC|nr:ribosome biogenesis GTP-binding protein YihA/YsxC [Candidatus Ruthturnera calyptogenae]A1AVN1.1 RecName: Full=Probable GTP-binding protein EngB [Candidatus Ruthia magnifica str. Cm (Calyptogena magnifica)]ABL01988.1 cell division checkpoint GTPase YihA [Candidatus Ruthia magnifica str. Cm (Calyptogena magnifica)]
MHKHYHQAKFLLSCPSLKGCPPDEGYEVIFAGRSNAGKSSVINTLTLQNKLAKVSRTPGKTQHFVFFELDKDRRLVDLPGYGYAKVPKRVKTKWHKDINEYFNKRDCLRGTVLVMDIRHPFKLFDQMVLNWCHSINLSTQIILTKSDKLKKGAASNTYLKVHNQIKKYPYVDVQLFSSLKKQGLEILGARLNTFFGYVD